jgi:RNA polymerase sigma-32 factor
VTKKVSPTAKKAKTAPKAIVPIAAVPVASKAAAPALPHKPSDKLPASSDPLQRYFTEVSRYPILSAEEEAIVSRHYQEHQDTESAQKLVLSNLRLVVKIAMEYRNAFHNLLDLIQEGNMGLMRAVQKFDPEKGVRFVSYAAWWVRAYILKYILDNFRLVKIGTTQAQKKLFFNLMKEKERMEREGFIPSAKLLSERMDVKEREVEEMQIRMGSRDMELDAPKAGFDGGALNLDFLSDANSESPEQTAEDDELRGILLNNLEQFTGGLQDKERKIFHERLFAEIPKTLQEIADAYGITRERIRQIENKVIHKMQDFFKAKGMAVDVAGTLHRDH